MKLEQITEAYAIDTEVQLHAPVGRVYSVGDLESLSASPLYTRFVEIPGGGGLSGGESRSGKPIQGGSDYGEIDPILAGLISMSPEEARSRIRADRQKAAWDEITKEREQEHANLGTYVTPENHGSSRSYAADGTLQARYDPAQPWKGGHHGQGHLHVGPSEKGYNPGPLNLTPNEAATIFGDIKTREILRRVLGK